MLCVAIEDIDTAVEKVQNFIHNGMKIHSIKKITHGNMLRGVECNEQGQAKVYDLVLEDGAHVYFSSRVGSHNCGSAIASSSLATEWVMGKTVDEAAQIKNTEVVEILELPPIKVHCSVLAEDAIKAAIADYKSKKVATATAKAKEQSEKSAEVLESTESKLKNERDKKNKSESDIERLTGSIAKSRDALKENAASLSL